jgi:PAS domain S-box-containing protein
MTRKLCILTCDLLGKELATVVETEGWDDVTVATFPAQCGRPQIGWDSLAQIVPADTDCSHVRIMGCCCLAGLGDPPPGLERYQLYNTDQCFYLVAGHNVVDAYLKEGAYLLTPGWLAHWRHWLDEWGFDQAMAREYLAESTTRLLLLDTGVDTQSAQNLREFADFVGRPFEIVPVGLDYLRLLLARMVLEWQLEDERAITATVVNNSRRQMADYAMALDLLSNLTGTMPESEVVENILHLFNVLFAPGQLCYMLLQDGKPDPVQPCLLSSVDVTAISKWLAGSNEAYAWTDSGDGFLLRIGLGNETLAVLMMDELTFPEYKEHYLNLALAIADMCGLAIRNARTYERIKRAEETLRESEGKYRQLFELESDAIFLIANETGQILEVNTAASGLYGYSREEFLSKKNTDLSAEPDETRKATKATEEAHGERVLVPVRYHRKKDGTVFPVEITGRFFIWRGHPVHIAAIRDITERMQAEEELRRSNLELLGRNEELDAFAHTVAHDLKNPISQSMGFAELLEQDYKTMPEDQRRESLHAIVRNEQKTINILEELLLLAEVRKMDVKLEPLDMASIVAEAQQRLTYVIEQYQAEIVLPATWPAALGHAPWVEEVWVNYLSNGCKYGGEPPRLELGADPPFPFLLQAGGAEGGHVRFWVRDNGSGISPEDRARLFTPFTRLDQARARGHGLGLSIVRRIVEKLGGQVGVESDGVAGHGSVFSFTLPAAPQ